MINKIFDYVTTTPHNTNKAILKQMLEEVENKTTSWNDLEDKPFDEVETKTMIVEEQTIPAGKEDGGYYKDFTNTFYKDLGKYDFRPYEESTKPITVIFDGNIYEYDGATEVFSEGVVYFYVGNGRLVTYSADETDEPFALAFVDGKIRLYVSESDMDIEHSIKVYRLESDIKTLDPKYLPKASVVADVTEAPTAEDFNALLAALREAGYLAT